MPETTNDELRVFLRWTIALQQAMDSSIRHDDPANMWRYAGFKNFALKYNRILQAVAQKTDLPPVLDQYNEGMKGSMDTVVPVQKEIFDSVYSNVSMLRAVLEGKLGVIDDETTALKDFIRGRLRSAVLQIPEQERDIQDVIELLLIGRGMQKGQDYDREVGRVKISSKELVPDFCFPPLSTALEVKLVKTMARVREVVDEIKGTSKNRRCCLQRRSRWSYNEG